MVEERFGHLLGARTWAVGLCGWVGNEYSLLGICYCVGIIRGGFISIHRYIILLGAQNCHSEEVCIDIMQDEIGIWAKGS